jgi:hypothetical protein
MLTAEIAKLNAAIGDNGPPADAPEVVKAAAQIADTSESGRSLAVADEVLAPTAPTDPAAAEPVEAEVASEAPPVVEADEAATPQ